MKARYKKSIKVFVVLLVGVPLCVWFYICARYTGWLAIYLPPGENEIWARRLIMHTILFFSAVLAILIAILTICLNRSKPEPNRTN